MHRDNDRYRTFSRRAVFLFGGKFVLMSGLIGRMYYLQVIEGDRYKTLADENRISLKLLAPPRGRIVDRFGRPLAVNRQNYRILLVPENVPDLQRTFTALSSIVPISEGERKRIKREIKRRRRFLPIVIRENLTWPQVARIEANSPELPGLVID
ncbi:MAG: penicillin-binding protein 2, partial [Rhodospirillales bacterium]|nr:penicillin-binding protein 2 [Rhodospirillales bacterium]